MATRDTEALDRTLAALADPTRRAMVERLAKGGRMAISDLATPFAMSLPAVLKHVAVLTDAGLVSRMKVGRTVYCHLLSSPIRTALAWLRKYEDYQPPAVSESAPVAQKASRKPTQKAGPARAKRPAAKAERKTSPRAASRTRAPKTKAAAGGRAEAAPPQPALQRGGRPLTGVRRRPGKAAAAATVRRRPRR